MQAQDHIIGDDHACASCGSSSWVASEFVVINSHVRKSVRQQKYTFSMLLQR